MFNCYISEKLRRLHNETLYVTLLLPPECPFTVHLEDLIQGGEVMEMY